jgi:hypothetical protein
MPVHLEPCLVRQRHAQLRGDTVRHPAASEPSGRSAVGHPSLQHPRSVTVVSESRSAVVVAGASARSKAAASASVLRTATRRWSSAPRSLVVVVVVVGRRSSRYSHIFYDEKEIISRLRVRGTTYVRVRDVVRLVSSSVIDVSHELGGLKI